MNPFCLRLKIGVISGIALSVLGPLAGCTTPAATNDPLTPHSETRVVPTMNRLPATTQPSWPVRQASVEQPVELKAATMPDELVPAEPRLARRTVGEAMGQAAPAVEVAQNQMVPLDLPGAMSIVSGEHPLVARAGARYRAAYARLAAARVLWLPTLRAGVGYHHHDGNLQASDGAVLDVDRSSLQGGLGVGAVGAGTSMLPGVEARFHSSDAIFQPHIAAHAASARNHAITAATNDALLHGALAYMTLLEAEQLQAVAGETHSRARELKELTEKFANAGQGPQADADRARTELAIRTNDQARALENVEVANARLVEALSLDPQLRVIPEEPTLVPVELIDSSTPANELLAIGLSNRPELREARNLVCEAVYRYRREKCAPLLPSILLGVSQSEFGGGVGGEVDAFARRFDFDAIAYWELRNVGFGEHARRMESRSVYQQRRWEEVRLMDRIAREINEALAQARSRIRQIEVAESAVSAALESYQRNRQRIGEGAGLPIEVLQSIQALDDAQREYVRTIADYNEAQFRLQRAIGWAIQ